MQMKVNEFDSNEHDWTIRIVHWRKITTTTNTSCLDQDPLTKISSIFCGEVDKTIHPQRQVVSEQVSVSKTSDKPDRTWSTSTQPVEITSTRQARVLESIDEGRKWIRITISYL
jgi:hypothetical protein